MLGVQLKVHYYLQYMLWATLDWKYKYSKYNKNIVNNTRLEHVCDTEKQMW